MDGIIHYLNCDLDLASPDDLSPIAAALEAGGVHSLHVTQRDDSSWIATFETDEQHTEPDSNIAAILTVIESLDAPSSQSGTAAPNGISISVTIAGWNLGNSIRRSRLRHLNAWAKQEVRCGLRFILKEVSQRRRRNNTSLTGYRV
ncbi:hypothetical protein SH668x_000063 [Planctomicrobium sp. SH668]|uniref:hypothetical protein n=1 Tax=Planctomicrobium sp. SH668 TaxID=3448126 RepID=UPI003F5C9059